MHARLDTGGNDPVPVPSGSVVRAALENLELMIKDSHAHVQVDPLPTVLGDEKQLTRLFQNLIVNSIKFKGEMKPVIRISAECVPPDTAEADLPDAIRRSLQDAAGAAIWHFSVEDNGIGIDPTFNQRIFVIFQRLHSTGKYPGTGIGLAICKKIVVRHGGRIWVESEANKGSTFYFTLREPPSPEPNA